MIALTLLYFFLRQFLPELETAIAVILTATSPLYMFWSRTFMLESTGVAAALGFGLVFWRYLSKPHWVTGVLSVIVGLLAATIKPPTVLSISVFAAGVWLYRRESRFPLKRAILVGLPVLVIIGAGTLLWQRYTHQVLAQLQLAEWMNAPTYASWFFGHLPDRFNLTKWHGIKRHLFPNLLGYEWWLIFLGIALWIARPSRLAFIALFAGILPALIFFNIFAVHDYYWYETAFFFIIAVALCLAAALRDTRLKYRNAARIALVGILLCSCVGFWRHYRKIARWNPTELRDFARAVRDQTERNDVVVIYGYDWNPEFSYYLERLALQDVGNRKPSSPAWQKARASLDGRSIGGVVFFGPYRDNTNFVNDALKTLGFSKKVGFEYEDTVYKRDHAIAYLEKAH